MASLARDQHGNAFEVPPEAAYWRVRRHTRGRPSTVLGPDGEPLYIPISWDKAELRGNRCCGSLRLEAVDADHQPVNAPVAYVEIADDDQAEAPSARSEEKEMVRVAFEAQTRMVEAMQRAQVEHERANAQEKRALTEALVAKERIHAELIIALAERAGSGKPQDPVNVLKQGVAFQKLLDGTRNAGLLPAPEVIEIEAPKKEPKWAELLRQLAPVATGAATELAVQHFSKGDEKAATQIRRNFGQWTQMLGETVQGTQGKKQKGVNAAFVDVPNAAAPAVAANDNSSNEESAETRPTPPKAIREVQAALDDEEAAKFDEYLDSLDAEKYEALCKEAATMPSLDARLPWVRGLIRSFVPEAAAETAEVEAQLSIDDIPPALMPVLAQLSPEERMMGAQILAVLDRATVAKFLSELQAMPPEKAVATIRRAIEHAQRRGASVAHRAIAAALSESTPSVAEAVS